MQTHHRTKNLRFLNSIKFLHKIYHLRISSVAKVITSSASAPMFSEPKSISKSHSFHRSTTMLLVSLMVVAAVLAQHTSATAAAEAATTKLDSEHQQAALNYLLFSSSKHESKPRAHQDDQALKLENLLKDTNHSHVSDRVDLKLANSVWDKMHKNVEEFAHQRVTMGRPIVNRLLDQANTSVACRKSINHVMDRLERLDDWAVRMYNSFGDFLPNGFFEGTHTSMGDYHQCVNLEPNQWIGAPQYCTFKYQPVLPKRPKFHNILATINNLANFTEKDDMFHGLAEKAHYFYYTKMRLATCLPTKCEKTDLERLGEQIAVNTYLQFQGISCLEKSKGFNPDGAQIFALSVLLSLASVSFLGTLVHMFDLKSFLVVVAGAELDDDTSASSTTTSVDLSSNGTKTHKSSRDGNHTALLQPQQQSCKTSILPTPVIQQQQAGANSSATTKQCTKYTSTTARKLVQTIDFLMHFSIIKNGRKLFDTSTSRRENSSSSRPNHTLVGKCDISRKVSIDLNDNNNMADGAGGGGVGIAINDMNNNGNKGSNSGGRSTSSGSRRSSNSGSAQSDGQSNDISCVHGLRFWTISWIILGHTMQYTEWAGFGRAYQVEQNITSFLLHPLLNATFSVDTFFLISGLLTTYVTWTITRGQYWRFNKFAFLISRYLRLTPQVLLVMLLFIVFPLMGDGPYWSGLIQKESDNCKRNWWVSALYLQSFYRQDQICNLVTWWLSIEMFYHFVSIIVIIALLHSARKGIIAALVVGGGMTAMSCYLHYVNHYPPNMLPTLLQRYEIWDSIVLKYFWTPYPHAPAYFTGLLLGYALYNRSINQLSRRQVRLGWLAFAICYLSILFGTYQWNKNAPYSRAISTIYYNLSQIFWSLATGWAILACALGNGGWLNSFLSSPVFVPLGRATYMTYLSHMLIVMAYPAKMNLLIEPSYTVFLYIFISNMFLSYALGIFLTLVYESPILHLQKLLVSNMALKFNEEKNPNNPSTSNNNGNNKLHNNSDGQKFVRVALYPTQKQQVITESDVVH